MTIVEFFDKTAIENIAGTLLCKPEKVIFVGDKRKQMENKVLVATEIEKLGSRSEFIRARAEDMRIITTENAEETGNEEFDKVLCAII